MNPAGYKILLVCVALILCIYDIFLCMNLLLQIVMPTAYVKIFVLNNTYEERMLRYVALIVFVIRSLVAVFRFCGNVSSESNRT
jgi:hypothetical protein